MESEVVLSEVGSQPVKPTLAFDHERLLLSLRDQLTEAALHRFDVARAVLMVVETLEQIGLEPLRVSLVVLSLHPSLAGVGFTWRQGSRDIARTERPWAFLNNPEHAGSPLDIVMTSRLRLRFRLEEGEGLEQFAIVREFAAQGATDYAAFPLFSPRPDVHVFTMLTARPGGWTEQELTLVAGVMPTLALLIEVFEAHRLTSRERIGLLMLAHTDTLTRLSNRHGVLMEGASRFGRGRPCLAIYIDLDGVKTVNDRMGHSFGDQIIQSAAVRITAVLPPEAVAGRMGGDEFLVFADERYCDLPELLRAQLAEIYSVNEVSFNVTASIGVAPYDDQRVEELARRADLAMLASKQAGKNLVTHYVRDTDAMHLRLERVAQLLPLALTHGEVRIAVQPIVSLATGALVHGECLARWTSPQMGVVNPDEFVPVAEQSGDIAVLDRHVLRMALRALQDLAGEGARAVPLCVNVSAKDSSLTSLDESIARELSLHGIAPSEIVIELTESVFINRFGSAVAQLKRLRDQGIAISLDDFGTGYSSLSYLQRLQFDIIKIDRSLISALPCERTRAIIESVITLGHALNARIVGEGVETVEQRDGLIALGCEYAQGYLFSRPLELDQWKALVRSGASLGIGGATKVTTGDHGDG